GATPARDSNQFSTSVSGHANGKTSTSSPHTRERIWMAVSTGRLRVTAAPKITQAMKPTCRINITIAKKRYIRGAYCHFPERRANCHLRCKLLRMSVACALLCPLFAVIPLNGCGNRGHKFQETYFPGLLPVFFSERCFWGASLFRLGLALAP